MWGKRGIEGRVGECEGGRVGEGEGVKGGGGTVEGGRPERQEAGQFLTLGVGLVRSLVK